MDILVVAVSPEIVAKVGDLAYIPATIPANTYNGQTTAVPAVAVQNYLVTREDLSTDAVYRITKALWASLDQLANAHVAAKAIELKHALDGMPVPLHPGAEKYYREVGLIK
jgi:TRAP transporter TAXI family solute receptor